MNTKRTNFLGQNKNILLLALGVALVLMVPLIAMQFTDEVDWGVADFIFAGVLLFGTGLTFELITRKVGAFAYRAAVGLALITALFLLWGNLAVGMIGSEDNAVNMLYFWVILVLVIGSLLAQFKPQGMARVLFATAITQAIVTAIVLVAEKNLDVFQVLQLNGFFIALWVGSALLFRQVHKSVE